MVGDVKRSIAWMKSNAGRYGPAGRSGAGLTKVVLAGGSSGGHLALLATYTPGLMFSRRGTLVARTCPCVEVAYYPNSDQRALYA